MPTQARALLFLCVANAARSQMAEALARRVVAGRVPVLSAGSAPREVHPLARQVMSERGIDMREHRSKGVEEIDPASVAIVITLCAEEFCPIWPGPSLRLHWPMPDPAAEADSQRALGEFRRVATMIEAKLNEFVAGGGLEWCAPQGCPPSGVPG